MEYEAVIGLEVHIEIRTRTKMFCGCPNQFGQPPNTLVCPVCLGYPGVLPVPNREAVDKTIAAGLMCGCRIAPFSKFDRKNYFYPDMPKNYQISQYDLPICTGGEIPIAGRGLSGSELAPRGIRLTRIHLEEDVAKSVHLGEVSGIDFNRAGVPLMEIVSEPDMHTADEAYAYLTALKQVMQYAEISDCDMEKGQLRCDVNVSLRPEGSTELGEKIEVKNLNSFRAVHRALEYEIERQMDALDYGDRLQQETRRWDDETGRTVVMRTKESAHDYRYFPEPDLMPLEIDRGWVDGLQVRLPEAPWVRRARFVEGYGLTPYAAQVLTLQKGLADYFEAAAGGHSNPKSIANWIQTELLRALGEAGLDVCNSPISPTALAELVALIDGGTISGKIAKEVFAEMFRTGALPQQIVASRGLEQVTDTGAIEALVERVISENPGPVAEYLGGKGKALQYLVGQVMRHSRGKANPKLVVAALRGRLDGDGGRG
ncbi:MAG: Asp-tRNA(Asn)/Glu-tRNA(Gln) amidotransferase subunit GatB [Kiritimatiellaeota bacterium]|nr:Asp-tRNA(Asn)/Glu-tRNA(Gln) amidotransferase subunit GatB [Kiritimatiellota bacterium]